MSAAGSEVRWDELARGAADAAAGQDGEARAREQLLTFTLDGAPYAIPVDRVREIVRLRPITSVPRVPSDVLGVISLRGEIVQVIDLRRRLGLRAGSPLARARIVIVREDEGGAAGLLVDGVDDVFALEPDSVQPPTAEAVAVSALCLRGDAFVSLVDLEKVWDLHAGD